MGYRIEYPAAKKLHRMDRCRTGRGALTVMVFLVFLLLVGCFWPEGREVLWGIFFSGDRNLTAGALEELARQLGSGMGVKEAFSQFCGTVLEGSGVAVY